MKGDFCYRGKVTSHLFGVTCDVCPTRFTRLAVRDHLPRQTRKSSSYSNEILLSVCKLFLH